MVDSRLHLLVGKEEFPKRQYIEALEKKLRSESADNTLEFQQFHFPDDPFSEMLVFAQSPSLFGHTKMAVGWDIDAIGDEEQVACIEGLKQISTHGTVVLVSSESSTKKSSFLKNLSLLAKTTTLYPPSERELPSWLRESAKKKNLFLEGPATQLLMDRVGRDTCELEAALEKLSIFAHPRTAVSEQDIRALLGRSLQHDIFQLASFLLLKDAVQAVALLESLLQEGGKVYEILAVLAGQFEKIRQIHSLLEAGKTEHEIGEILRIHPYYLAKTVGQAVQVSREKLDRLYAMLLECDENIKLGSLPDRLALEKFVLELCV